MTTEDLSKTPPETLYAGKYKTVAELEEGYKQSLPVFQENQNLKQQVDNLSKVPEEYITPPEIGLHADDVAEAKRIAKNSNLTQAQYERMVNETNTKALNKAQTTENAKKEVGADKLNILQDYVKNAYPEKLQDTIMNKLIHDKDARDAALLHRDQMLRTGAPGIGGVNAPNYGVTKEDVHKAREESMKQPHNLKLRQNYLKLTSQFANNK